MKIKLFSAFLGILTLNQSDPGIRYIKWGFIDQFIIISFNPGMTSKANNYFVEKPASKPQAVDQTGGKLVANPNAEQVDPLEADKLPMPTLQ